MFLSFLYPFEWIISKTSHWELFVYILFWSFIGFVFVIILQIIGIFLTSITSILVRQQFAFALVLFFTLLAYIIFYNYMVWTGSIEYSWLQYPHPTTNKIIYTLLTLSLLSTPIPLLDQKP